MQGVGAMEVRSDRRSLVQPLIGIWQVIFFSPAGMSVDECCEKGVHANDLLVRESHAYVVG